MFKILNDSNHRLSVSLAHPYSNQPLMYGFIEINNSKEIKVSGDINNYVFRISVDKLTLPNEEDIKQRAIEEYIKDLLKSLNFDDEGDKKYIIEKLLEDSNYY